MEKSFFVCTVKLANDFASLLLKGKKVLKIVCRKPKWKFATHWQKNETNIVTNFFVIHENSLQSVERFIDCLIR